MKWFDQRPDRPGYYWYVDAYIFDIVRIYRSAKGPLKAAGTAMFEGKHLHRLDGKWAGPIPSPKNNKPSE